MKQAREARGLSVAGLASRTKIPLRHIEAFERGEALDLPPFYQRAEIRALARAVCADEQMAVTRLDALLAPIAPLQPDPPESGGRVRSGYVLATLGTAFLVAMLAWDSYGRTAANESRPDARRSPVAAPAPMTPSPAPSPSEAQPAAVQPIATASIDAPVVPRELVITTQPEGARVTVNGIGWGVSPVTIKHLEPGKKRIRVSMDGYTSIERSVTVDDGRRNTVRIIFAIPGK